jgi:hypothetical protein
MTLPLPSPASFRDSDPTLIAAPPKRMYRPADLAHACMVRPNLRPISRSEVAKTAPPQASAPTEHASRTFVHFALFALGLSMGITTSMIVHGVSDAVHQLCSLTLA